MLIVLLLVLAIILRPNSTSVVQSESFVSLSGNAYVTSLPDKSRVTNGTKDEKIPIAVIDEQNSTIRDWRDTETVISFYFGTAKSGKMNIALQAKGHSHIEVSLLGKKNVVKLDSDTLARVEVGTFKIKNPGYIKMEFVV